MRGEREGGWEREREGEAGRERGRERVGGREGDQKRVWWSIIFPPSFISPGYLSAFERSLDIFFCF